MARRPQINSSPIYDRCYYKEYTVFIYDKPNILLTNLSTFCWFFYHASFWIISLFLRSVFQQFVMVIFFFVNDQLKAQLSWKPASLTKNYIQENCKQTLVFINSSSCINIVLAPPQRTFCTLFWRIREVCWALVRRFFGECCIGVYRDCDWLLLS